mgnify:CR=1 FL=1
MNYKLLENERTSEYYALDVFKLIFAFAVVAIHIDPLVNMAGSTIYKVYKSLIYLAVPFFFTVSGFLMGEKLSLMDNSEAEDEFLNRLIKKYVHLYLIWTLIYAPLAVWHYIYENMQVLAVVKSVVIGFFWFGENYNSWILWYLLSSVYSLIFIYVLRKLNISYSHILIVGTIIALIAIFLVDYKNGLFEFPGTIGIVCGKISKVGARVTTGFFYLPLGIVLSLKKNGNSRGTLWGGIIIGIMFEVVSLGYGFIYELGRALATIGIVCALVNVMLKPGKQYLLFRKLSSDLYYWHLWIWTVLSSIAFGFGNTHKGLKAYLAVVGIVIIGFGVKQIFLSKGKNRMRN